MEDCPACGHINPNYERALKIKRALGKPEEKKEEPYLSRLERDLQKFKEERLESILQQCEDAAKEKRDWIVIPGGIDPSFKKLMARKYFIKLKPCTRSELGYPAVCSSEHFEPFRFEVVTK